jgi:hypothetical protein
VPALLVGGYGAAGVAKVGCPVLLMAAARQVSDWASPP